MMTLRELIADIASGVYYCNAQNVEPYSGYNDHRAGQIRPALDYFIDELMERLPDHLSQPQPVEPCKLCSGRGERTADGSNGRRVRCTNCAGTGQREKQPQPVAQGEAVAYRLWKDGESTAYTSWMDGKPQEDMLDLYKKNGRTVEYAYATPTIPTGHRVVDAQPVEAVDVERALRHFYNDQYLSTHAEAQGEREKMRNALTEFAIAHPRPTGDAWSAKLPADRMAEAILSMQGPDGEALDGTLWLGPLDDGTYGVHLSCDECPEEGSITLAVLPAPTVEQAGEAMDDTWRLAEEGLDYFEKAGDAGDKLYVEAIRTILAASPSAGGV